MGHTTHTSDCCPSSFLAGETKCDSAREILQQQFSQTFVNCWYRRKSLKVGEKISDFLWVLRRRLDCKGGSNIYTFKVFSGRWKKHSASTCALPLSWHWSANQRPELGGADQWQLREFDQWPPLPVSSRGSVSRGIRRKFASIGGGFKWLPAGDREWV